MYAYWPWPTTSTVSCRYRLRSGMPVLRARGSSSDSMMAWTEPRAAASRWQDEASGGLLPMVVAAERLEVGDLGGSAPGVGFDVVPFDAGSPVAS